VTLRIAFIGAGQMARHHASAITRSQTSASIVGVTDRATERADEFAAAVGTHAFPSIDALLDQARPDVVHVCTPPPVHFEAAYAALDRGAHVYVEKPFALTIDDATTLLEIAESRGRLVCAGHQLLKDPAYTQLMNGAGDLGAIVQIDSHFAFRPPGASMTRRGAKALARQLVDILPHPLYVLVAALERFAPGSTIGLAWAHASPTDVQAVVQAGAVTGRLSVSLRSRPVASWLSLVGTRGSRTCDYVRSMVIGAGNPGTEALEKIFDPMLEGAQLVSRTTASLARRLRSGVSYPGLADLIGAFHHAVATGGVSPVPPEHLLRVTGLFEDVVARIGASIASAQRVSTVVSISRPECVVVTGARGFLGREIAKRLPRVRGIGRDEAPDGSRAEWVVADLSGVIPPDAIAGADVVVHAAAETAGSYPAHQRNTIDATRHLLHAMHAAGVSRLVLVSSLSVIAPPRSLMEVQDERTPRAKNSRPLGAYTWGKCLQEELVEREAAALGIATRIVRPGALIDWRDPELPGLMGRRLFGQWHLGLGRPRLPIAVCDVERCAEAIAWCAMHFDDAPHIVNLLDPDVATRGDLIVRLQQDGWKGRMVWMPISLMASALKTARAAIAWAGGRRPEPFSPWAVLRPRRYDASTSRALFDRVRRDARVPDVQDVAVHA
jgi:predicted dehydrogenase/nucleoside-diphosphate-sugar epimerase